jgi:hypothetical protein
MRAECDHIHGRVSLNTSRDHLTRIVGSTGPEIHSDQRVVDKITLRTTAPLY